MKLMVTGGAGFIGSFLVEKLLKEGHETTIVDNLSTGKSENVQHLLTNPLLRIVKMDLKNPSELITLVKECDLIYHLAANPEVKVGETSPKIHFGENIQATFNLLEAIRQAKASKTIVFASTSTVYGEASKIPTPENYGPLIPISTYGASKLACEALITSYACTFNHRAVILRLANIVGPRSNHGVIVDFIRKIAANPRRIEILGDGTQEKSYMYISDCIEAVMQVVERSLRGIEKINIYNVGSSGKITIKEIAKIVADEMHRPHIQYVFTGGVDGGRGWRGDVKIMQLSIDKLLETGWKPRYSSQQAVKLATRALLGAHLP